MKEKSKKKEEYLLRLEPDLFYKLCDCVQKEKRKKGRGYSVNRFITESILEKLNSNNKNKECK